MMNLLMPMAGRGDRFKRGGFNVPKPLVSVAGQSMVSRAINNLYHPEIRFIFAILKDHAVQYNLDFILKDMVDCDIIYVDEVTSGPASTCLLAEDLINTLDSLCIVNVDQIIEDLDWNDFWKFADTKTETARHLSGVLGTFDSQHPKNSYARVDEIGLVVEVKEKEVISPVATNGLHYWSCGDSFVWSAKEMIARNDRSNGEFYIAPTFNYLIEVGCAIGTYHFNKHFPIGTPGDLLVYERHLKGIDHV